MTLTLNGRRISLDAPSHHTLLDVLRNQAGLIGTKECCDAGECGACTVLLNGRAVTSCLVLAAEAADADVVTICGYRRTGGQQSQLRGVRPLSHAACSRDRTRGAVAHDTEYGVSRFRYTASIMGG